MTEEMKPRSQELLERLHAARLELDELVQEQRAIGSDLEAARREDASERLEAIKSGGKIRSAIASLSSRVRGVEDRAEALPDELWTARMRVAQLDEEYHAAKYAELGGELPEAQAEFREVDALLPEVQKRRERALDYVNFLNREMRDLLQRREGAAAELERLSRSGPE